jgi:DNA-binding CsgD family transcriptional regulator
MDYESDERYATQRSSYLVRITNLRETEAEAIAYSELGYSDSAIASKMDTSQSTVSGWKERAMALYGLEIAHPLLPDEERRDITQVGPEYLDELEPEERRVVWLEAVIKNENKIPMEWHNSVLEYAKEEYLSELREARK